MNRVIAFTVSQCSLQKILLVFIIVLKGFVAASILSTLPHLANKPGHETNVVEDGDDRA